MESRSEPALGVELVEFIGKHVMVARKTEDFGCFVTLLEIEPFGIWVETRLGAPRTLLLPWHEVISIQPLD